LVESTTWVDANFNEKQRLAELYVTEQGADRPPQTAWQMLKPDFSWLDYLVSWKAIIAAIVIAGIAVGLFVITGGINISADQPDSWVARHFLHFVFKTSIGSRARGLIPPDDLTEPSRVRLAAQHFDMVCANCHGRPGFGQSVVALSMSPRPQDLPKVLDQFTPSELYLIVTHGVKYSAMPSWPTSQRADEVWSMVAFLQQLRKMDGKTYSEMTALPEKSGTVPIGSGDDTALLPANAERNAPPIGEFLYAAPASGFSDATVHADPTATCARCHGADGTGAVTGGEAPNLTIQDASYLRTSLEAYVSGARKSGFMQNIAAQLSGAQIVALSDHYAGLAAQAVSSPQPDPALAKRGEAIAIQGIRERAIPACANCHESDGSKITGAPHIAGQSATFLRRQLGALRLGGRGSAVAWNPMPAVAHDLDDSEIAALAAFYSGLKPAKGADGGQVAQLPHAMLPKGDVGRAKEIFETRCVKCHANDGRGDLQGGFPDLTLQSAPYVGQTLFSFRTRARTNDKMIEVTDSLNFDELTSLANYVGSLTPQKALAAPDADAASRGAATATKGIADRGVPACLSCHDAKGVVALPLIPRLQGQSPVYLRSRLDNFFKSYDVDRRTLNPMPAIASKLTEREREDLAAYFAAAAPLEKAAAQP
jgi:cytochrome c553